MSVIERKLFTVREAAAILGVQPISVYRWIHAGQLPARRLGSGYGPVRVSSKALVEFAKPWRRPAPLPDEKEQTT